MARTPNIRIRKKDQRQYKKLRRNVKQKINRTQKKYGVDLSNEIPLPDLQSFTTRKEFNEWKEQAKSFTKRSNLKYQFKKNKYGVVANKRDIQQAKRDTKRAQEIAENARKATQDKPFISGGKQKSTYGRQQMMLGRPNYGGIYYPKDFNFNEMRTQRTFETRKESMAKRASVPHLEKRMETMQQNYIDKLHKDFNSDGDHVAERVRKMPAKDFYEMTMMYQEMNFGFLYTEDEDSDFLNVIEGYLDRYDRGDVNTDLSIF